MDSQIHLSYNNFTTKVSKLMLQYQLIPFLSVKEIFTLGNVNQYFRSIVQEYGKNWKFQLEAIALQYHLDLKSSPIDLTLLDALNNQRAYKIEGSPTNYIQLLGQSVKYCSLANGLIFPHYNNESYWQKKMLHDSLFGGPTFYLNTVCWVDINISIPYVRRGKYKVFLRQNLKKSREMLNALTLTICSIDGFNSTTILYSKDFLDENDFKALDDLKNEAKNHDLFNCYITTIDLTQYGSTEFTIEVKFFHKNLWWKGGWYIDAAILEPL